MTVHTVKTVKNADTAFWTVDGQQDSTEKFVMPTMIPCQFVKTKFLASLLNFTGK